MRLALSFISALALTAGLSACKAPGQSGDTQAPAQSGEAITQASKTMKPKTETGFDETLAQGSSPR